MNIDGLGGCTGAWLEAQARCELHRVFLKKGQRCPQCVKGGLF